MRRRHRLCDMKNVHVRFLLFPFCPWEEQTGGTDRSSLMLLLYAAHAEISCIILSETNTILRTEGTKNGRWMQTGGHACIFDE